MIFPCVPRQGEHGKLKQMRAEFIMRLLDFPRFHLFAILLRNYGISAQYLGSDEAAFLW